MGAKTGRPKLIILAGPPAAGKTSNARPLADAIGYSLLSKDEFKERLADAIGKSALEFPGLLDRAVAHQIVTLALDLLSNGIDLIIEGYFQSDRYSVDFAKLVPLSDAVLIHMRAADSVLKDRYEQRALANVRHWIHGDLDRVGTLLPELPPEMGEPLHLAIPCIVVDTNAEPLNIATLVANIALIISRRELARPT